MVATELNPLSDLPAQVSRVLRKFFYMAISIYLPFVLSFVEG